MKSRWTRRLIIAGLIFGLAWKGYKLAGDDPFLLLLYFISAGAVGGLIIIHTLLPWLAEALGQGLFLPGGQPTSPEEEIADEALPAEDENEAPTSTPKE